MIDKEHVRAELDRLKGSKPFRTFDIVTNQGDHVFVGRQFAFAYSDFFVSVYVDSDIPTRIFFKDIERFEMRKADVPS